MLRDSVAPLFDAGLVRLVELGHVISPEVRLTPSSGNMPGHVSVTIASRASGITGEMAHQR